MVDLAYSIPHYMEQRNCRKMAGRGLRIRRSGVRISPSAPIKSKGYVTYVALFLLIVM